MLFVAVLLVYMNYGNLLPILMHLYIFKAPTLFLLFFKIFVNRLLLINFNFFILLPGKNIEQITKAVNIMKHQWIKIKQLLHTYQIPFCSSGNGSAHVQM